MESFVTSAQATKANVLPLEIEVLVRLPTKMRDAGSLETYKDWVAFHANTPHRESSFFEGVKGLMGAYPSGTTGTVMEDTIAFGQEWRVLGSDPMLFHT